MKRIIHLSDLHFGTERPEIIEFLVNDIEEHHPDVIVISGDLTQRALSSQFKMAKIFLDKLSHENIVCVPGNHDISLYNLIERFFFPFHKYHRWITYSQCPMYYQDDLAILGINSVTPFKIMSGFVTKEQLQRAKEFFQKIPETAFKIIVMHHNLIKSERHKIINDAEKIISIFASCNINLVLSGHIHFPYVEQLQRSYLLHKMYVVTAGTPISTRTIEPNSFNILELEGKQFKITVREFKNQQFVTVREQIFPW